MNSSRRPGLVDARGIGDAGRVEELLVAVDPERGVELRDAVHLGVAREGVLSEDGGGLVLQRLCRHEVAHGGKLPGVDERGHHRPVVLEHVRQRGRGGGRDRAGVVRLGDELQDSRVLVLRRVEVLDDLLEGLDLRLLSLVGPDGDLAGGGVAALRGATAAAARRKRQGGDRDHRADLPGSLHRNLRGNAVVAESFRQTVAAGGERCQGQASVSGGRSRPAAPEQRRAPAARQPRAAAAAQRTHIVVVGRTASRPGTIGLPHTVHVQ